MAENGRIVISRYRRMTRIEESRAIDIQYRSLPLQTTCIHQLIQLIIQKLVRPLGRRTRDFVGETPKINQGAEAPKLC